MPDIRFGISLQFEIFFALQAFTDPRSRLHGAWQEQALGRLPGAFAERFMAIGGCPDLWAAFPDLLTELPLEPSYEALRADLLAVPCREFQLTLLGGLLHDARLAGQLVDGATALPVAIARVPRARHEWLGFIGLYPYQPDAPMAVALERLLVDPEGFRADAVYLIDQFWERVFAPTWQCLQPELQRSLAEKERLFQACSLAEFAQQALLRIHVDERRGAIQAVRGGFEVALAAIDTCYILPSLFNDKRFWSARENTPGRYRLYFPYFDPALVPELAAGLVEPELDPALIFKALGDTTRYAMATLLASAPRTATELARTLAVSKPTISHHLGVLRDAGLLASELADGAVRLTLRREALEQLTGLAIGHFYDRRSHTPLATTRRRRSGPEGD